MTKTAASATETATAIRIIGHGEVDPKDLVIDEAANGRAYPAKVDEMAVSLIENGQEQPITIRTEDGRKHVVFGFRRARGGLYIIEHKMAKGFMLRYQETDCTAAEAFMHNLVENKDREGTTVVDDAKNYLRLTGEPYNLTGRAIAKRLKVSEPAVSRALSLVRGNGEFPPLSPKILKLGHAGKISAEVLYELVGMAEDARDKYVARITTGAKVTAAEARNGKKKKRGDHKDEGRALTAKAIREPFQNVVAKWPENKKPTVYVGVCDLITKLCTGAMSATGVMRKLKDLVD